MMQMMKNQDYVTGQVNEIVKFSEGKPLFRFYLSLYNTNNQMERDMLKYYIFSERRTS